MIGIRRSYLQSPFPFMKQIGERMMRHTTELLAPAGSYDSLKAAVGAGADAVYLGGARFGARAYADNFEEKELCEAIGYAHLHGCDLYLTVNTLLKDEELEELGAYLRPYYESGLDGVIVQDFGVLSYIREYFPDLPVHASTQMTVLGPGGAAFLKEQGAVRIVTARELSLEEIQRIHSSVDIEIESFIHGALCYCYSGQCLLSSMLGGRSGNRGRCAQPCRLPYQAKAGERTLNRQGETYLLSPKDMCTVELLPRILEAGVSSLKIEGRMKRPEYTAGVVEIYRKYLDYYLEHGKEGYRVLSEDLSRLKSLYNRGGFSKGYYQVRNGREMMSLTRPGHFEGGSQKGKKGGRGEVREKQTYEAILTELKHRYVETERKEKIKGSFRISTEFPTEFVVTCKEATIAVRGEPAQTPKNQPADPEAILRSLRKTGDTPFVFEELYLEGEEKVFLPVRQLNSMRREALGKLEAELRAKGRRERIPLPAHSDTEPNATGEERKRKEGYAIHVQLECPESLPAVLDVPEVTGISLSSSQIDFHQLKSYAASCHQADKSFGLVLPSVFRSAQRSYFERRIEPLKGAGIDFLVVKNLEETAFLKEFDWNISVILDQNLYTFNQRAHQFWKDQGIFMDTLPLELNEKELRVRGCEESEMIVYGYLPLMVTANCLHKTLGSCGKQQEIWRLADRYKKEFLVVNECRWCYNVIYNCEPLSLLGNAKEVERISPKSLRLSFVMEDNHQIQYILRRFVEKYCHKKETQALEGAFTRGHLKRGVE